MDYYSQNFTLLQKVDDEKTSMDTIAQIHCFPLTAILFALNMTNFDFLRLNNNGRELHVLKTIDFKNIKIQVNLNISNEQ